MCDLDDLVWERSDASKLQYNDYVTPVILVYKEEDMEPGAPNKPSRLAFVLSALRSDASIES